MTSARVRRGRETEQAVANYLAEHGFPGAERIPAGLPGTDTLNVPFDVEVKARRDLRLNDWLKQAEKRGDLAVVVHRPDGMGLAQVANWPMTMRLATGTDLLAFFFESLGAI